MSDLQRKYIWAVERARKAFPDAEIRDAELDFGWTYSVAVQQGNKRTAATLERAARTDIDPDETGFSLSDLSDKEQEAWVEKMLDGFAASLGVKRADKP